MGADLQLALGAALALGGVAVLRLAWARKRRSTAANLAGWTLLAAAAGFGWSGAGAWGVSVASLFAMGLALLLLALAAAQSPPDKAKASNRRAGMLPEGSEPLHLARRIVTFLMVGVAALASAIAFAVAARALAVGLGAGEADANTLALFLQPLAWAALAYFVLMAETRRRQAAILLASAAPVLPAILIGGF